MDGDGADDFGIGAPNDEYPTHSGKVYLWYSAPVGTHTVADADAILLGENVGDRAGQKVQFLEDLNGDGFGEVVVGAGGWGGGFPWSDGRLYVLPGPLCGTISLSEAEIVIQGSHEDTVGYSNLWSDQGRDLDGDGLPDFIFGDQGHYDADNDPVGNATIILGSQVF